LEEIDCREDGNPGLSARDLFFYPIRIFFNEGFPAFISPASLHSSFMKVVAQRYRKGIGGIE
jgi:hypothetical protein